MLAESLTIAHYNTESSYLSSRNSFMLNAQKNQRFVTPRHPPEENIIQNA